MAKAAAGNSSPKKAPSKTEVLAAIAEATQTNKKVVQAVLDALAGEIKKETDVRQLAFEIQALAMGANWSSRLLRDPSAFRMVRGTILQRIDQATGTVQSRE